MATVTESERGKICLKLRSTPRPDGKEKLQQPRLHRSKKTKGLIHQDLGLQHPTQQQLRPAEMLVEYGGKSGIRGKGDR